MFVAKPLDSGDKHALAFACARLAALATGQSNEYWGMQANELLVQIS